MNTEIMRPVLSGESRGGPRQAEHNSAVGFEWIDTKQTRWFPSESEEGSISVELHADKCRSLGTTNRDVTVPQGNGRRPSFHVAKHEAQWVKAGGIWRCWKACFICVCACVCERDRTASKLNKYYNFNITSETAESCFFNRVLHCAVYLLLGKVRVYMWSLCSDFFFLFLWATSLVVYLWLKTSSLGNLLLLVHYSTSLWCSIRKESKTFRFLWTEHLFRSFFSRFLVVEKCPYPTLKFNLGK